MGNYEGLIEKCDEWICKVDNFGADDLANHISACADAIEQLVKERDAAVADLKNNGDCSFCKHEQVPIDNEPCNSCMYDGYESNFSNFEWRGV